MGTNRSGMVRFLLGVLCGALLVSWLLGKMGLSAPSLHTGPALEQVQALAELVTVRAQVSDVLQTRIAGYTGGMQAAMLVKGEVLLGTDLSKARFEAVSESRREAVLVLPVPHVTAARVDAERTKLVVVDSYGLWRIVPGREPEPKLLNRAYREAQQLVSGAATQHALVQRAQRHAEQVLGEFFEQMHWSVQVRWI